MDDNKLRSNREQQEWYPLCPVQVRRNIVSVSGTTVFLRIETAVLTAGSVTEIEVSVAPTDERRQKLAIQNVVITPGLSEPVPLPESAMYVQTTIETVRNGETLLWERAGRKAAELPAQETLWQTDPLYAQLRRECAGIVEPIYQPDTIESGWRCTCGQINLTDRADCCRCHGNRAWMDKHFDRAYLAEKQADYTALEQKKPGKKINYKNEKDRADRRKMIAILASFATIIALIVLTFTLFIPSAQYRGAEKALAAGEYDEAIAAFSSLGGFRDAKQRVSEVSYQKAQAMTGLTEIYPVSTESATWFSISEDGVLSFRKDDYTGSWDEFVIPDVVDGIVVRELERNFFLNCKELKTAVLSDCLEVLGEQTFFNCESLTEVRFGANLHTISARAFINCTSLETLVIPDTVTTLGLRAFNSCTALTSVTLGKGITELPSYLFSCCSNLRRVNCLGAVASIGEYAFSECPSLQKIYFPAGTVWENISIGAENDILNDVEIVIEK